MKELLKQAFQAGRDFGHAMGTGRPTYGLTFDEWYSENKNQALSLADVIGRLLTFYEEKHPEFDEVKITKYDDGSVDVIGEKWIEYEPNDVQTIQTLNAL